MAFDIDYAVGTFKGRSYTLHAEAVPGQEDPDEFVVNVSYLPVDQDSRAEVARVDTSHDFVHFDKLFLPAQPKVEVDWEFWEAVDTLNANWETYAAKYEENHA